MIDKTREQAILICAIAASTPGLHECYATIAESLDVSRKAENLAFYAWEETRRTEHPDAEAEALLQMGWEP